MAWLCLPKFLFRSLISNDQWVKIKKWILRKWFRRQSTHEWDWVWVHSLVPFHHMMAHVKTQNAKFHLAEERTVLTKPVNFLVAWPWTSQPLEGRASTFPLFESLSPRCFGTAARSTNGPQQKSCLTFDQISMKFTGFLSPFYSFTHLTLTCLVRFFPCLFYLPILALLSLPGFGISI